MSNGELVLGNVVNRSEFNIIIEHPMLIIIDRHANNGSYYIGEYMAMVKDDQIPLFYKDIICVVEPDDVLLGQYNEMFSRTEGNKKETNHKYH